MGVTQPSIYIPHGGGPAFFMTGPMADLFTPMAEFLASIDQHLPGTPDAMLVVSAHWEAPQPSVTVDSNVDLIYDYYGFPPETYELTYPAKGAPALAERALSLLTDAGLEPAPSHRGWDHGVFIPLKVMYPQAEVPVVAMSIDHRLDADREAAVGRALAPLREENVLIVGSGLSYHNLSSWFGPGDVATASSAFDGWLGAALTGDRGHRTAALSNWREAPFADQVHPRADHLMPLMTASAAGSDQPGRRLWTDTVNSAVVSAWAFD